MRRGRAVSTWLGGSRLGLVVMALLVGAGAGLGAVVFRELVYAVTWIATGHEQFGQQGRVASLHLAWLGIGFFLVIPVLGGLLYGPLIQRFAREARGHGVPEVMLAVAENGGRIRPQVTVVKALASALCIGTGGSVGREGPIVQIGSAFASTVGQWVRMSERSLRIIVACGAAGGIAGTFNAPLTGLFFGFEIVLREFSLDALFGTALSAVTADLISRAFFGSAPFFSSFPHNLLAPPDATYLLIAVLGLAAGLLGVGFKTLLYGMEDYLDRVWKGRPEWARPAVGGIALGVLLLALPQMYGVGYPVMDNIVAGHEALWLIVILMLGKVVASSLTLSIGGSGGVFAPSLFTGAAGGMAFGLIARHIFGTDIGPAAMYAVIAMGGVFAGATQAPLTAIASVLEMTGNFTLTLPVMLACGIAAATSKQLTYGSIYTTKLLRRGIDIEQPKATSALATLSVAEVMQPVTDDDGPTRLLAPAESRGRARCCLARAVGQARRSCERRTRPAGALRRRGSRARVAPTRALRPRRATRPLPRRAHAAGMGHARGRHARAHRTRSRIGTRDRARRRSRRLRRQGTAQASPRPQPHRWTAMRSSRSRSARTRPPADAASARCAGRQAPAWSLPAKDTNSSRPAQTSSCAPASESYCSPPPQPHRTIRSTKLWYRSTEPLPSQRLW